MTNLYDRLLDRISLRAMKWIISVCLALAGGGGFFLIFGAINHHPSELRFVGDEVAEWHITAEGRVLVHSRITLSNCPSYRAFMPVELPYESAKIESVSMDGRPVQYVTGYDAQFIDAPKGGESKPGIYVALDTPAAVLRSALIEVVWSFPMAELPLEGDNYRIRLRGLIPVKSYVLVAVLDDGCGFELAGGHPELRMTQPFSCMRRRCIAGEMGTCGLAIRPKQSTQAAPAT
jgi:hypothetical protein